MSKQQLKQAGFTIIEVVLVLAIAALIFLMVFIALPALQRSQRDDARKKDVATVSSAVQSWIGNNRSGGWPDASALQTYIGSDVSENTNTATSGDGALTVVAKNSAPTSVSDGQIIVVTGAACDTVSGEGVFTVKTGTKRQYVVITRLESGNSTAYCLDS